MKTLIYIFLFSCLAFSSCIDDLLDKKPIDRISDDAVFSDQSLIEAYLYQIYSELPLHMNNVGWSWNPTGAAVYFPMVICDEALQQGTYWEQYVKWNKGLEDATNTYDQWWGYDTIRKINEFIDKIQDSFLDTETQEGYIAEVRFLRAFAYFELVKRYGGVPLITRAQDITDPEEELYVARSTEKEIYDFIHSELSEVCNLLPEIRPDSEYGRATKFAALALDSRAMLYAGSIAQYGTLAPEGLVGLPQEEAISYFQKSYDASMQIYEYSNTTHNIDLYNKYPEDKAKNFYELFMDERNVETIFSVQYNGLNGKGHSLDYWMAVCGISVGWGQEVNVLLELVEAFEYIDGTSGKLNKEMLSHGSYDIIELFKNKDPRFQASILYQDSPWQGSKVERYSGTWIVENGVEKLITDPNVTINGKPACSPGGGAYAMTGFTPKKYYDERLVRPLVGQSETDFIVFRYGEILLNLAEAAFELNRLDEALNAINILRDRAGIERKSVITMNEIRNERRVELAFEQHRLWDVRRWRTAVNDLSGDFSGMIYYIEANTGKYRLQFNNQVDGYSRLFQEKHYYHPITPDRISNNPKLKENPGY